jgi:hypothetical protein
MLFTTIAVPIIGIYTAIAAKSAYNNAEHILRYDNLRRSLREKEEKSKQDIPVEDITSAE